MTMMEPVEKVPQRRNSFHCLCCLFAAFAKLEVDVPHPKWIQLSNLIERFIPCLGIYAHKDKVTLIVRKRNPSESGCSDESVQLIIFFH